MASSGNFLLLILISFFTFVTTQSQDNLFFIDQSCSSYDTSAKSVFHLNLNTLLSSLSSNASHSEFYNTTIVGESHTDSVYGVFMCRGDITPQFCQQCVQNATQRQPSDSECYLAKQAVIWYDVCMVRYSNRSFFSTLDTTPPFYLYNPVDADKQKSFMHLMFKAMNETADEAARGGIGEKKYATGEEKVSEFHTLYCLAQCTPDLSPLHCRTCLNQAIGDLPSCCQGTIGGRVLYPSCNIRYELYPFYRPNIVPSPKPTPIFVPASNFSKEDSRLSEDPIYLFHNCSDNTTFTANSTFQLYLNTLLSDLSSKATSGNKFHKEGVADTVYGLFMCRGDLPSGFCGQCVLNATHRIASACSLRQEAIIWYSHCLLRYSYRYFFSQLQTSPMFSELNITPVSGPTPEQSYFTFELSNALEKLAVGDSSEKYVTLRSKLNAIQTLYTLAQCTQDLSGDDCDKCLEDLIGTAIPWSQLGSVGGRVLYPSCNLRFELFQFYSDHDVGQAPPPRPSHTSLPSSGSTGYGKVPTHMSSGERRKGRLLIIITIVVFIVISGMLFFFSYYLLKRKARKSHKIILKKNFGDESSTLESLQFKLAMIKAATNNFSNGNRIGKGGFGEVYKGILDGRQIAVKRLSKNSKQGATEFKNEVLLIAKLQHINLVALIGFCLEEEENILIYEYVLNKSLDYFLFDSRQQKLLSWFERYNIIGGIGRGILYLHEDSRLKVIHRDLKPSNVLLDENMIPKISDFGLARIVEMNQDKKSTGKIVGTHGYISPEYAMFGQFSEKSDIFSFGVIILEIITGKHNLSSHKTHNVVEGLFSYVWKQWTNQTPLNILDPNIEENYSEIEVIRCIQIGLLCIQQNPSVRPTIATIVEYLSSHLIELPIPLEPAFLLHDKMGRPTATHESSSNQSNNSTPYSLNVMSLSNISPR